ncbi:MAG TPA: tetratricopeptide repeat protein [Methylibium sp.]|uniref:tetratricopeptide repeat protein n=1 Tax=Methylibium sp. TaxID=2067992 RepID=UPI002DBA4152|nr:tetratricopeptide repeat protein [Methylibium sp.]HEU4459621.1 tetratricopeptide repeat protein [Methylibium sp.]
MKNLLSSTLAVLLAGGAFAAPLLPRGDDEIVEVLPVTGGYAAEQKKLRRQLAQQPRDATTALALSRSTLARARHDGDARLAGQALGALAAWDGDANAPVEIRLQRAVLRQYLHEFDASVAELEGLLRASPRHPQALLTLATVLRVQGRYDESDAQCLRLTDAGAPLYARACLAENRGLRGEWDAARREFDALIAAQPANAGWVNWIRTSLGELEARAGRPQQAAATLRAALKDADDSYTRFALADVLIDQQRWAEARQLLGSTPLELDSEASLLRRAIVAAAAKTDDAAALRETMAARYAQSALRPEAVNVHARERSRFALEVAGDAARALALARVNLESQREPVDFVVMDRAARAAGDAKAQAEVAALAERVGLRDARLSEPAKAAAKGRS